MSPALHVLYLPSALRVSHLPSVVRSKCLFEALTNGVGFDQIAAEVAAPLAKTDEIVMVGGNDSVTNGINRIMSEVPPAFEALTGVDLIKVSNALVSLLLNLIKVR